MANLVRRDSRGRLLSALLLVELVRLVVLAVTLCFGWGYVLGWDWSVVGTWDKEAGWALPTLLVAAAYSGIFLGLWRSKRWAVYAFFLVLAGTHVTSGGYEVWYMVVVVIGYALRYVGVSGELLSAGGTTLLTFAVNYALGIVAVYALVWFFAVRAKWQLFT
jgi:hypothetical protein